MRREKLSKLKYFIPAILVMIMIFWFSSQPKSITNEKSDSVIKVIKDFVPFIKNSVGGGALVFIVRKSAHIFEFTLLFLSLYYGFFRTLVQDKSLKVKSFIYSALDVFLYACTDEFHYVDCAIGKIFDKSIISGLLYGGTVINGVSNAILGENIAKVAFVTGLTKGNITTIGATTETEFKENKVVLFKEQILGELSNSVGDSGSVVVNDNNEIIGLLYAGTDDNSFAYINDINVVLDKLNVEVYTE